MRVAIPNIIRFTDVVSLPWSQTEHIVDFITHFITTQSNLEQKQNES